ncbi:hypothetical protein VKT23_015871 [Stygiomarasmius scandens]|uniref:Uncharacterized protein n=1 Tax=Marasmiellus scandens TaxID=2682957 RepID=A0ABR1IZY0_9AGAR
MSSSLPHHSHLVNNNILLLREDNPQTSLSLDVDVISKAFSNDGQEPLVDGEVRSLTSSNNFINFCALYKLPLSTGLENKANATCNPVIRGAIPSVDFIPSSKFRSPLNGDTLKANVALTVSMQINNLNVVGFTDEELFYLSAPQQLDAEGKIMGLSMVVIEGLDSVQQTQTTDPKLFTFVKGTNIAQADTISINIESGLPVGEYRLSSITAAANWQPVIVSELAHGAIDDTVYNSTSPDFVTAASLTSTNNYINFCLNYPSLPVANGQTSSNATCNPAPMGLIGSADTMPSSKFLFPKHLDHIASNSPFTVRLSVNNMQTGSMTNSAKTYLSAPQEINEEGLIIGHAHVVIEELTSLQQDLPTNPKQFAFFAELGEEAVDGILETNVTGLPDGVYRLSSTLVSANHAPVIVAIVQHGSLNDMVYFTVGNGGNGSTSANTLDPGFLRAGTSTTSDPLSTSSNQPSQPAQGSHSHPTAAAIGGAIAGGIILILLIASLVLYRRCHNRKRRSLIDPATTRNSSDLAGQINPFLQPSASDSASSGLASLISNVQAKSVRQTQPMTTHRKGVNSGPNWMDRDENSGQSAHDPQRPTLQTSRRGSDVSGVSVAPSYHTNV